MRIPGRIRAVAGDSVPYGPSDNAPVRRRRPQRSRTGEGPSTMAKKKYDVNAPGAKALIDEIVHGTFMKEGTMVAFPTCFPGASVPIPADESRITALDITPEGIVYGGTSGRAAHLFVGMFHGVTGVVFDLGAVEGARQCTAVCCGRSRVVACVNDADGGRLVACPLQGLPFDLIQEWGFARSPLDDWGRPAAGEPILHALADASRSKLIGITAGHVFMADLHEGKPQVVGAIEGAGRLAIGPAGGVFGLDGDRHLWRFDPRNGSLERRAVALPAGTWDKAGLRWARDASSGLLYTADAGGNLYAFADERAFAGPLGRVPLAPVGPMAVTHDGRLFGFCGSELARMFCYDPHRKQVRNLGVAVSVFERRRYGYVFGDAVTGRDGEIVFGEDDDLGHVWLYFPRIEPRT